MRPPRPSMPAGRATLGRMTLPRYASARELPLAKAAAALATKEGLPVSAAESTQELLARVAVKVGVKPSHEIDPSLTVAALLAHYAEVDL